MWKQKKITTIKVWKSIFGWTINCIKNRLRLWIWKVKPMWKCVKPAVFLMANKCCKKSCKEYSQPVIAPGYHWSTPHRTPTATFAGSEPTEAQARVALWGWAQLGLAPWGHALLQKLLEVAKERGTWCLCLGWESTPVIWTQTSRRKLMETLKHKKKTQQF